MYYRGLTKAASDPGGGFGKAQLPNTTKMVCLGVQFYQ